MNFFPEIHLDEAQAEAIARGLYAVAKTDGLHEREAALVGSFIADVGGHAAGFAALERQPKITGAELASALEAKPQRLLFLKTALLLAWADGKMSDAERAMIEGFAGDLGASAALAELESGVKEYLLSHLSSLKNTDAAVAVARELKV